MPMPPELAELPESTAIVGNIEAFILYVSSGEALKDWNERIAQRMKDFETYLGDVEP